MKWFVIVCVLLIWVNPVAADGSVFKRVSDGSVAFGLAPLQPAHARAYESGFKQEGETYVCDNGADPDARRGVSWSMTLNQKEAAPVAASAEAKVLIAEGSANSDFSLYVDLTYMDGSHLWGQTSSFDPDSALGWQRREVIITPDKPIRSLAIYLLFRNRSGKVLFRNPQFGTINSDTVMRFDGVVSEQAKPPQNGFLLRDVAAGSDFVFLTEEALGVRLSCKKRSAGGVNFYDLSVKELTGKDRALTLVYTRPLKGSGAVWFHDPRRSTVLENKKSELMNATRCEVGSSGLLSRYPFGAVASGGAGIALGLDPSTPVFFRIGCQPQTRELFLACDIGFAKEKNTAQFSFCEYEFDPSGEFRSALSRYYEIYPEAFRTRIKKQGLWMPFAPVSKVEGWQDFGFRIKEGTGETAWDDAHDILTFRYTEPMTWWMRMNGDGKRTLKMGAQQARRMADAGDKAALAWLSSSFEDKKGRIPGRVRNTPWCNGVVWSMNSAPGVVGEITDFKKKWNPQYIEKQYGPGRKAECDGEYIDSSEAYVTEVLDYRRSHFAGMERPLCYALRSRRVGIYKGMIGFEYIRALEQEMHKRGHFMMANSTPNRWFWFASLLDVMGTETNWNRNNNWEPMSDEQLLYRRAMCKGKPFCFLMNTDFSQFSYECSERYMKRCLAYGMFPGYFSADASTGHYFKRPELYNRDRPLFKKYVPLCKLVAEAGWEPLTGAVSDNENVIVERFGNKGLCYLTVFNLEESTQKVTLRLTGLVSSGTCRDLVNGTDVHWKNRKTVFELPAEDVRVLEFSKSAD